MISLSRHAIAVSIACALAIGASQALSATEPAPTSATAQYEVRFMSEMIDHHAMAVMMGELCLSRATVHEELRAMCNDIIDAQLQEIATMQMWLGAWYGVTYQPAMTPGMQNRMDRMAQMAGAEFEIAFMQSMIRHHWKAVVRSSQCVDRAYHDELVELCAEMIEAQVAEITTMRTWLCEWYGICNYGPKGAVGEREEF